jgi:uncharacterized protein (DUF1499 family)
MEPALKISLIIVGAIIGAYLVFLGLIQLTSKRPTNLGIHDGKLVPCPKSYNCVCSFCTTKYAKIEPYVLSNNVDDIKEILIEVIKKYPRTKIIEDVKNYVYCEFWSLMWRFIDDVEFLINIDTKTIHFRSSSRIGVGDMGMNRKRMEEIRQMLSSYEI